jgi:hypothetical protein
MFFAKGGPTPRSKIDLIPFLGSNWMLALANNHRGRFHLNFAVRP